MKGLLVSVFHLSVLLSAALSQCGGERCSSGASGALFTSDFPAVELRGRCHVRCAKQVLGADHLAETAASDFGPWSSVSDTLLQLLEKKCRVFFQLKLCVLGCTLAPEHDPTTNDCRNTCDSKCQESCSYTQSCGTTCTPLCRRPWCRHGCRVIINEGSPGTLPSSPLSFTVSARAETGSFDITSANASQSALEDGISAFIFRVEAADEASYVLQSSLSDPLDLSYFSCQEVNLSLAVVNRHGSSQFTPPTPLCVHGVPGAPQNFSCVNATDDLRPGFFGQAVIGCEWDSPPGGDQQGLQGYELTVTAIPPPHYSRDVCGTPGVFSDEIPKSATTYVLKAASPGNVPLFGPDRHRGRCSYQITLQSLPKSSNNLARIYKFTRFAVPVTAPQPPSIDFSCDRETDPVTGLTAIRVRWIYEYIPLIQEAITKHRIDLVAEQGPVLAGSFLFNSPTPFQNGIVSGASFCSNGRGFYTFNHTSQTDTDRVSGEFFLTGLCSAPASGSFYTIRLYFLIDDTGIWWRPTPQTQRCRISASP